MEQDGTETPEERARAYTDVAIRCLQKGHDTKATVYALLAVIHQLENIGDELHLIREKLTS